MSRASARHAPRKVRTKLLSDADELKIACAWSGRSRRPPSGRSAKATRALAELDARRAADEQEAAEHRAAELDRWHIDDQTAVDATEAAKAT